MNFYNKFKLTLFSCLVSQQSYALNLMPIDVQSTPGELLYAEIRFQHADVTQPLRVSLASVEDLRYLGVSHQPPGHLNFFVRQSGQNTGVITITSSRPVIETELNVVVKIQHAGSTRLQHIKTRLADFKAESNTSQTEKKLVPIKVLREEEIPLTLATSTQYQAADVKVQERPLAVSHAPPPLLQGTALTTQNNHPVVSDVKAPVKFKDEPKVAAAQEQVLMVQKVAPPPLAAQVSASTTQGVEKILAASASASASQANTTISSSATSSTQKHTVQNNESLWSISAQIAKQQQRSTSEVMQDIHNQNPHAFIAGDRNRLRRGAVLDLNLEVAHVQPKGVSTKDLPVVASKQSGKAKYRLNEAQMSLVAEKQADSAQGSAKKSTQTTKSSQQLALKVMTSREKSVKLQRNVTHLDQMLKQKDHRIQLLNTRLAQLQQQLKAQQVQKK